MNKLLHIIWNISFIMSLFWTLVFLFISLNSSTTSSQEEHSTVFVLDVSQSMKVIDVDNGSRLSAAKSKIFEIISENQWHNYALNIFAWESQRILPLTQDLDLFSTFLDDINSDNLTIQWTNLDLALRDAINSFLWEDIGDVVILSDWGEDHGWLTPEIVKEIKNSNIHFSIVGIWSIRWGTIPTGDIKNPYKTYQGKTVISKLSRSELIDISQEIWGKYYDLNDELQLWKWYYASSIFKHWFLLLALLFWIMYISTIWYKIYYEKK